MMKSTISKILLLLALFFASFAAPAQVSTQSCIKRTQGEKNWVSSHSYGQTSYQVDRSVNRYQMYHNGEYIYVYYYYLYFYNESYVKVNNQWVRSETYIPSYTITIDGIAIGPNWMLVTGDYYYATYWSIKPYSNVSVSYSSPIPY